MRELVNLPYELDSQDVLTDAVASKKRPIERVRAGITFFGNMPSPGPG